MPYFKCNDCHHEWEGSNDMRKCDWCGGQSHILEEVTPFEKFVRYLKKNSGEFFAKIEQRNNHS